jgi:hypothetical protein
MPLLRGLNNQELCVSHGTASAHSASSSSFPSSNPSKSCMPSSPSSLLFSSSSDGPSWRCARRVSVPQPPPSRRGSYVYGRMCHRRNWNGERKSLGMLWGCFKLTDAESEDPPRTGMAGFLSGDMSRCSKSVPRSAS